MWMILERKVPNFSPPIQCHISDCRGRLCSSGVVPTGHQGWGQVQYLYLSTYLSVLDVLEYLVPGNVKVLVLDQKVLGTYQVIFKYYLLKTVKVANYLNTLLLLSLYLVPTTDSIVGFVASLA